MHVLFDLDGTLTDPREGIVNSLNHALTRLGERPRADAELIRFIGPPLADTFATLLKTGNRTTIDAAIGYYREWFAGTGLFENRLYDGIPDALAALTDHPLYVATSKPYVFAAQILEHFGIAGTFATVYGSELDGTRAHKYDLLGHALADIGAPPAECVMVGDTRFDVEAARDHGCRTIAVAWGYGREAELAAADVQVSSVDGLAPAVAWLAGA